MKLPKPDAVAEGRIFWCPSHGRMTEALYEALLRASDRPRACQHCEQWYHRAAKFKAKRPGES